MKLQQLARDRSGHALTFQQWLCLIAFAIVLGFAVFHLEQCIRFLSMGYALLSPFLLAVIFAFLLNIPLRFFERHLFSRESQSGDARGKHRRSARLQRCCGILLSLLCVLGGMFLVLLLVVPELIRSIIALKTLTESVPSYFDDLSLRLNLILDGWNLSQDGTPLFALDWNTVVESLISLIRSSDEQIMSLIKRVTSSFFNVFISVVFSLYLLAGKESIKTNLSRVCFAFFSRKTAISVIGVGSLANQTFSNYVTGQLLESFILGALCYIGMTVLRLPFPLLISTIVAMTGFIPVFGALIGGVIGGIIILVINPIASVWFLLFLILLQNVESNFIYPKVMSDCVGLPGIWVIATLFVFGQLFGLMGVFIGIPTVSVFYTLLKQKTSQRLRERNLSREELEDLCDPAPYPHIDLLLEEE